jgi:hypothetical protein
MLLHMSLMKNLTIAIAGLLTLTVVGLSIVSYTKFRKRMSEKKQLKEVVVLKMMTRNLKQSIQQDMVAT